MKQRVVTGTLIAVGAAAIFAGAYFVPVLMNIMFLLLTLVGIYECFSAVGIFELTGLSALSAVAAVLFSVCVWLGLEEMLLPIVLLYLLLTLMTAVVNHEKYPFSKCGLAFFTTLYVVGGFGALSLLGIYYTDQTQHWMMMLLVVFGSWFCDVGGWLFGRLWGRHKLCARLSPKKTVEGLLGSAVLCVAGFVGLGFLFRLSPSGQSVNIAALAVLAPFFTVFEVFGDLAASALKREYGVKDFGNIFPGHGGIMDRFDGIMVSALFVFLFSGFFKLM